MGVDLTSYAEALLRRAGHTLFPEGGQGTARRNAWTAMLTDAARARARHEVEVATAVLAAPLDSVANG